MLMKKQYIVLVVAIILLVVSLIFLPIIGEILFIPFVYIFQYSCRSSNRRERIEQEIEENSPNQSISPLELQENEMSRKQENICNLCGAKIISPNLRYCESCGAKL